jgi:TolB protein
MRVLVLIACAIAGAALAASTPSPVVADITSVHLQQQQTEIRTSLGGGTAGRLPRLAIPTFILESADAELQQAGKTLADVLWKDLQFERGYEMVSQTGNAASVAPAPADALAFDVWAQIGADEVLVGNVRRTAASLQVEVRVMSVDRKVSTFAKRYSSCSIRSLRFCAHTIADELHKERFGIDGVARTKFAFVSDRAGERVKGTIENRSVKEIYTADYDGEGVSRVTNRGSLNVAPSWSPDGRAIVYQAYPTGFADIYIQRLFEVQVQPARPARGTDRAQNMLPAWSPDGSRIAFQSNREGRYDIYTVKADGSDLRRLTNDRSDDTSPTWNPTGTQIAFTSDRGGSNQIYIMSADGGPATKLSDEPKKADRPTWALDYIAYSAEIPGSGVQLKRINVTTRQVVQLTNGPGNNESPTVAPNGRHIAFVATRGGRDQIAIMDADGLNVRIITTTGNNRFPSWSPAPRGQ